MTEAKLTWKNGDSIMLHPVAMVRGIRRDGERPYRLDIISDKYKSFNDFSNSTEDETLKRWIFIELLNSLHPMYAESYLNEIPFKDIFEEYWSTIPTVNLNKEVTMEDNKSEETLIDGTTVDIEYI